MNLDRILREISPQVYQVDIVKLLKLIYKYPIGNEVPKIYSGYVI